MEKQKSAASDAIWGLFSPSLAKFVVEVRSTSQNAPQDKEKEELGLFLMKFKKPFATSLEKFTVQGIANNINKIYQYNLFFLIYSSIFKMFTLGKT